MNLSPTEGQGWAKGEAGGLSPPPLHLLHQIQERLLELGSHCVCLVESGHGAALAQALRGSLWGVAGEEVCHHLGRWAVTGRDR